MLILVGAVLSKVGVYGFLRVVVPILPDAAQHFQTLIIVFAVVSILYGSILAFSQTEARLVVAYSSIAQMGFIVLGIFALDPKGAQGAVMQMVTHGLVIIPLFFVVAALTVRAGGSGSLERMGGIAFGAPVLATLFLVITFATLAMPGSPNFVGELLILFGIFEDKLVFGLVASAGVVLAAVYMIRVFQRSMHNRAPAGHRAARGGQARDRRDRARGGRDRGAGHLPAAAAGPLRGGHRVQGAGGRRAGRRGGEAEAAPAAAPAAGAPAAGAPAAGARTTRSRCRPTRAPSRRSSRDPSRSPTSPPRRSTTRRCRR